MISRTIIPSYLISQAVALLCGILESLNGGIEAISLPLQALHLLTDGVHGVALILSAKHLLIGFSPL